MLTTDFINLNKEKNEGRMEEQDIEKNDDVVTPTENTARFSKPTTTTSTCSPKNIIVSKRYFVSTIYVGSELFRFKLVRY